MPTKTDDELKTTCKNILHAIASERITVDDASLLAHLCQAAWLLREAVEREECFNPYKNGNPCGKCWWCRCYEFTAKMGENPYSCWVFESKGEYTIIKQGPDKYVVYGPKITKLLGTYDTREKARAQIESIEASKKRRGK